MDRQPAAPPGPDEIRATALRLAPYVHRTPVHTCAALDAMTGARLHFKCESLQRAGAFKIRGATNAVLQLDADSAARGVATHSSGNHGAALALAARLRGIAATVVMPETASRVKRDAVAGYGAAIVDCGTAPGERERALERVVAHSGAAVVHPYDDYRVIAGQATATLELVEDVADLDLVVVPVGGGGLVSGAALVAHHFAPGTRVVAAEPAGADDARRSFVSGARCANTAPRTVADGLLAPLGERTFDIVRAHVHDVVTVSEAAIVEAMRTIWERMKLVVEPSAAVPLAALLEGRIEVADRRVGVILSGGNVDLDRLPWTRTHGEA